MRRTLLLVDDNPTTHRVVELIVTGEDIAVVAVDSLERAKAVLASEAVDIVLADAGVAGDALARHVKATPGLAHVPVLLLAGAFDPLDPADVVAAGYDGVVVKPLDPQSFIDRVRALLSFEAPVPEVAERPEEVALEPATSQGAPAGADDYFEQLDQAFAELSARRRDRGVVAPAPPSGRPPEPQPSGASGGASPFVEAFTALLAAERATGTATSDQQGPQVPPHGFDIDRLADEVARLVVERLSAYLNRDEVADVVAAAADRLIREEIERIKRNIT